MAEYEKEISHIGICSVCFYSNYGNFLLGNIGIYRIHSSCFYILLYICYLLSFIMVNILEEANEGNQKE